MKLVKLLAITGILFLAGCIVPVSAEPDQIVLENEQSEAEDINVSPTATPLPTATPVPTATPTPTPTPVPSVFEQIEILENTYNSEQPEIGVKAALLVNVTEDKVLYSQNATEVIYPASITKLMTALVAFSSEQELTQTVEISKQAVTPVIPSAKMCGFKAGDRILLLDLLKCMLIYSGTKAGI